MRTVQRWEREHMPGTNQATVQELRIGRDDSITANVAEGSLTTDGVLRSVVWYTLGSDLAPIVATLTSGLFAEHGDWQAKGVLPPWSKADEDQLAQILEWDAAKQDFATFRVARIVR